jgi:hypothetical protein
LIVLAGIALGQAIVYGPSLRGERLLLPLDYLAFPGIYLPQTPETRSIVPQNRVISDLLFEYEINRRFATSEFRAGRLPLWTPNHYAGAPFANFAKYSPFNLIYYLFPTPRTLAWTQMFLSLVAGAGAFLFFRRALGVGFWPASFGAWCYPLTGFFVIWQGFAMSYPVAWLPWILLLTDRAVRRPRGLGPPALAALTALTIISGQVDVAGHVLLASGIYALWCLFDEYRGAGSWRPVLPAAASTACAWGLGIALASTYLLPLGEYALTGSRMRDRDQIVEQRPPAGLAALPQIVLPRMYGDSTGDSIRLRELNLMESSACAYTGLIATLLLAPLAWSRRKRRAANLVWVVLGVIALGWTMNIPGLIALFRLPGLDMRPHNRFVFAAAFAMLCLAVVGLNTIWREERHWRRGFWLPIALLIGLAGWCGYRTVHLPEPMATQLEAGVRSGSPHPVIRSLEAVERVQGSFRRSYAAGALLSLAALGGWLWIRRGRRSGRDPRLGWALGTVMVLELLWFAYGSNPQTLPSLYFPKIPALEQLRQAPPGRVICMGCLPPKLGESHGLRDVRGYDGVDPARLVDVLETVRDTRNMTLTFARTQYYVPKFQRRGQRGEIEFPGVLDMLNLRYAIFRGEPRPNVRPVIASPDYWVLENKDALPRAYVPRTVETLTDDAKLLSLLGSEEFDPRRIAYVDGPTSVGSEARGSARIEGEIPTRITLSVEMDEPGLVVLADLWDPGWQASLEDVPVPILRTNHVLRGVQVPAGRSTLVFRYQPASLRWGFGLSGAALAGLLVWSALARRAERLCPSA